MIHLLSSYRVFFFFFFAFPWNNPRDRILSSMGKIGRIRNWRGTKQKQFYSFSILPSTRLNSRWMEKSQFQIFLRVGEKCWRYDSTRLGIAVKDEIRVNDLRETLLITIRGPPSLKFKLSFPLPPKFRITHSRFLKLDQIWRRIYLKFKISSTWSSSRNLFSDNSIFLWIYFTPFLCTRIICIHLNLLWMQRAND